MAKISPFLMDPKVRKIRWISEWIVAIDKIKQNLNPTSLTDDFPHLNYENIIDKLTSIQVRLHMSGISLIELKFDSAAGNLDLMQRSINDIHKLFPEGIPKIFVSGLYTNALENSLLVESSKIREIFQKLNDLGLGIK